MPRVAVESPAVTPARMALPQPKVRYPVSRNRIRF